MSGTSVCMNRGDGDRGSRLLDPESVDFFLKTGFSFPFTEAKSSEGVNPVGAPRGIAATPTLAMDDPTVESKLIAFLNNLRFSLALACRVPVCCSPGTARRVVCTGTEETASGEPAFNCGATSLRSICSSHDVELFITERFPLDSSFELTMSCSSSASFLTSSGSGRDACRVCNPGGTFRLSGHD